jgi:hypothetical protein
VRGAGLRIANRSTFRKLRFENTSGSRAKITSGEQSSKFTNMKITAHRARSIPQLDLVWPVTLAAVGIMLAQLGSA